VTLRKGTECVDLREEDAEVDDIDDSRLTRLLRLIHTSATPPTTLHATNTAVTLPPTTAVRPTPPAAGLVVAALGVGDKVVTPRDETGVAEKRLKGAVVCVDLRDAVATADLKKEGGVRRKLCNGLRENEGFKDIVNEGLFLVNDGLLLRDIVMDGVYESVGFRKVSEGENKAEERLRVMIKGEGDMDRGITGIGVADG